MSANHFLAKMIRRGARDLRLKQERLGWEDTEDLHALRVALQRLSNVLRLSRDLLPLAADPGLDGELRRMSRATGTVRN